MGRGTSPAVVSEDILGRNAEEEYLLALGELRLDDTAGGAPGLVVMAPPGLERKGNGASRATEQALKQLLAQQLLLQQQEQQPAANRQQGAWGQFASISPAAGSEEREEQGEVGAAPEDASNSGGAGGRSRKARQRRKAAAARQPPGAAVDSSYPPLQGQGNDGSWTNGSSNNHSNNSKDSNSWANGSPNSRRNDNASSVNRHGAMNDNRYANINGGIQANGNVNAGGGNASKNSTSSGSNHSRNSVVPVGMYPNGANVPSSVSSNGARANAGGSSSTYSAPARNGAGQVSPMSLGLLARVNRISGYKCMDKGVNVLEGLALFQQVLSEPQEQELLEWVFHQERLGQAGALLPATYSAPKKWMKGKGRIVLQYGSLYDYMNHRIDPETPVDPMPAILRQLVTVLVQAGVFKESERPDTAIINDYHEGDAIPPHIDHQDYPRPFCTVSLLSETLMLMGRRIQVLGPGSFEAPFSVSLPRRSCLRLCGNSADAAYHCIPSVNARRVSITLRRMPDFARIAVEERIRRTGR